MSIALMKFGKGNAHDDENSRKGWKSSKVRRSLAIQGTVVEYTDDADFDSGASVNVNHNVPGELQLDSSPKLFNFIWVACSSRGTIVKVDTISGTILGEYRSGPMNAWGETHHAPPWTRMVVYGCPTGTILDLMAVVPSFTLV